MKRTPLGPRSQDPQTRPNSLGKAPRHAVRHPRRQRPPPPGVSAGVSGSLSWSSVSLGDRGIGDVNFIFKYSSSQPTTPSATSISTSSGIPTGWSDSPPTNPNDGSKLWSSKGKAALSGSLGAGFSFNYTWETPVVHVQEKSDVGLASAEDKSSQDIRNEIVEADLVGSGNAFTVKPNKIELDDFISEEGRLRFKIDGGSFVNLDPFSSSARIAVNNVRQGIDPVAGSGTIRNSDITMNAGGYLNNIGTILMVDIQLSPQF